LNEVPPGLLATAIPAERANLFLLQGNYQNYSSHLVVIQFLNSDPGITKDSLILDLNL
jgi:hypothetical protein